MKIVVYRYRPFADILELAKSDTFFKDIHGKVNRPQEQINVLVGSTRLPRFSVTEHRLDGERNPLLFVGVSVLNYQVIFDQVHVRAESVLNHAFYLKFFWQSTEQLLSACNEIRSVNGLFLHLTTFPQDLYVKF